MSTQPRRASNMSFASCNLPTTPLSSDSTSWAKAGLQLTTLKIRNQQLAIRYCRPWPADIHGFDVSKTLQPMYCLFHLVSCFAFSVCWNSCCTIFTTYFPPIIHFTIICFFSLSQIGMRLVFVSNTLIDDFYVGLQASLKPTSSKNLFSF